jgi:rod shape-determining protein MreD
MGNFLSIPLLAVAAALQASFVPQIRILGGGPDFVFLLVLAWAINADLGSSVVWVFVGGIMQDLLSSAPLGTSVLGMLLVVFGISGIGQQVYRIGFVLLVSATLIGTLTQHIVSMLVFSFTGHPVDLVTSLTYVTAPTMFYNLILIWPIYGFIRYLQRRISEEKDIAPFR